MKSQEIIDFLIKLFKEYKEGIVDKEIVYERAEMLVTDNKLEYSENQNLKIVLEDILPDACLIYVDEPGDKKEKEIGFYRAICECEKLLEDE